MAPRLRSPRPAPGLMPGGRSILASRIGTVQLWPRTDACCPDRLQDVAVLVSDEDLRAGEPGVAIRRSDIFRYFVIGRAGAPTTIPVHRSGRYVRVQVVYPAYLDIAEVQVWGEPGA